MPTFRSIRSCISTALKVALCPAMLASLAACTPNAIGPTTTNMCPGIESIHQTKEAQGYSYTAVAPGVVVGALRPSIFAIIASNLPATSKQDAEGRQAPSLEQYIGVRALDRLRENGALLAGFTWASARGRT